MRIAVMQPYLYPYAGYFRLLAASDIFILYDDVQFPRRGRVHRCEIRPGRWLTLPLMHQPRDTLIRDLRWHKDARGELDRRLSSFDVPREVECPVAASVCNHLYGPLDEVVDFLETGIRLVAHAVGIHAPIIRSSALEIDPSLRGQARITEIVKVLGGNCYINAPGGRGLYDAGQFDAAGLQLKFLVPYTGQFLHILQPLLKGNATKLGCDIRSTCVVEN